MLFLRNLLTASTLPVSEGLARRGDATCAQNYTSVNGLHFTSICSLDLPCVDSSIANCDVAQYENITSLAACEDECALGSDLCYGVAYDSTHNRCWLKGSYINASDAQNPEDRGVFSSALADRSQVTPPTDVTCPHPNGSTLITPNGAAFEMYCRTDFPFVADYTPFGFNGRYHTDTFAECLANCTAAHPLCNAVAWNVDMHNGYGNCWLKNNLPDSAASVSNSQGVYIHSARLLPSNVQRISTSDVPASLSYTANGASFNIQQTASRSGSSNYTSLHADNITTCMDSCSTDDSCKGVTLDLSLEQGYKNCYLLNDTGTAVNGTSFTTFAQKRRTEPTPTPGGSKAWIAGAVIGPLIFIAILVAAFFLWRRRQRKRRYTTVHRSVSEHSLYGYGKTAEAHDEPYATRDTYMDEASAVNKHPAQIAQEMPENRAPQELAAQTAPQELDGQAGLYELPGHAKGRPL